MRYYVNVSPKSTLKIFHRKLGPWKKKNKSEKLNTFKELLLRPILAKFYQSAEKAAELVVEIFSNDIF